MQILPTEQISVVIPMYNEADNVKPFIEEVTAALTAEQHPDFEIIAVDDGSSDDTAARLQALTKTNKHLRVVRHRRNFGQSVGVLSGVRAASKPWVVTLDGDGQNDPHDIMKLAKAITKQDNQSNQSNQSNISPVILVAGHRINRKDSGWKKFGSRFANNIRRSFLKDDCPDTGCGIKLFPRQVFLSLPHFNHLHRYLPALFQRAGGKVINVAVNHRPRTQGQSKYGNFGRLKVGITDLIGVAWLIRRPCAPELIED